MRTPHALPPHDDHHAPVADGDDLPHHGVVLAEPRSPIWLPYVGAALLGTAAVWWLSTPSAEEEARAVAAASASASASAAASAAPEAPATLTANPAPAAPPPQPAVTIPAGAKPTMKVSPTVSINPNFKNKK